MPHEAADLEPVIHALQAQVKPAAKLFLLSMVGWAAVCRFNGHNGSLCPLRCNTGDLSPPIALYL